MRSLIGAALLAVALASCGGGGGGGAVATPGPPGGVSQPTGAPTATPAPQPAPSANPSLRVPSGFIVSTIAQVVAARELAALPNGDLIVGTSGTRVEIVPNADGAGAAGTPATFATIADSPAQGVAYGGGFVFVATQHGVYRIPYTSGAQSGTPQQIAAVRTGPVAPNSDGDVHATSSAGANGSTLYVGVGSSCNACTEADPTRATVQRMALDGTGMTTQAKRWRNAIAFATDPSSGTTWAGGAGQDDLPAGHPFEFMDPVSSRAAPADYGWPNCEENHVAYIGGSDCSAVVVPALEFPAYSTIIGAAFYPAAQGGAYAFPSAWSGGLFVGMHGSWHANSSGAPIVAPHVAFVPFANGMPSRAVNWSDPTAQWNDFFTGFQSGANRVGRVTGVAVGPSGSLFVADDDAGVVYRIRPAGSASSSVRRR